MTAHKPLPPTRDGFRYCWGEDDPELCKNYRQAISRDDTLKRLSFTRRKVILPYVRLSENDRAPQLKLDGEFTVTGEKGYCMIRATHCANRDRFYYEVTIDRMNKENKAGNEMSAARIGWGQKFSNLQAPLGYDQFGYSYRSRFGTKFHQAKGQTYDSGGGYGEGDVIGCMIELPYGNKQCLTEGRHLPASIKATGHIVNFKKKDNNEKPRILEEQDELPKETQPVLPGSQISFYKNGRFLGVAFRDLYQGFYYPSISLYKDCRVTVNFGPNFCHPPPQPSKSEISDFNLPWQPVNNMAQIEAIDNFLSDILWIMEQETDPEGNLLELTIKKSLMN